MMRLRRRFSGLASYVLAGVALVGLLTLALAPLSRSLVEQWSRRDVESRARLAAMAGRSGPGGPDGGQQRDRDQDQRDETGDSEAEAPAC